MRSKSPPRSSTDSILSTGFWFYTLIFTCIFWKSYESDFPDFVIYRLGDSGIDYSANFAIDGAETLVRAASADTISQMSGPPL